MIRATSPSAWRERPLCRRYVLAIFDVAAVRLREAKYLRDRSVPWAIGWLADGPCEPLGAWIEPETGADGVPRMLADLQGRGVERIAYVAGIACLRDPASAAFCGTIVRSPVDPRLAEATAASPSLGLAPPELVAEEVRQGLVQAVRRHGSFESEAAALDFIAGALQRAERRLDRAGANAKGRLTQGPVARTASARQ